MLQTANDILGYKGDVGLGLSESGALPAYGDTDTKQLNDALFNAAYLNMQKNKSVWDQKIKDRDAAMELINNGQLQINNALPADREELQGIVNDTKDYWFQHGGDMKSDPNVWLEFNKKLADFKGKATLANSRLKDYQTGMSEAAKTTNPVIKNKMVEHWQDQIKRPIEEQLDPYQQTLDWDPNIVMPDMASVQTIDQDGFFDVTHTRTKVDKAATDYMTRYQYNDKGWTAPNVDAFYDNFFGIDGLKDVASVGQTTQLVNKKLASIATELGYNPDDVASLPKYLQPLQLISNDPTTGKPGSTDTKPMAAFKIALANKYQNVDTKKFNPAYLQKMKIQGQLELWKAQGDAARMKAGAYSYAQHALGDKYNVQTTSIKADTTPEQNFDELKTKTKTIQTTNNNYVTRVNWDDLSPNTRKFLAVDPLTSNKGKSRFVNIVPTDISIQGKDYSEADVQNYYHDAIQRGYKGSMVDYLKKMGAQFNIEAFGRERTKDGREKGKLGRANRLTTTQNQYSGLKMNRKSLFLEDNSQPAEPAEEQTTTSGSNYSSESQNGPDDNN